MKKYLDKARGKGKVRLSKMKPDVPIAAWSLLRWSVASSTAYLEEIEDEDDMVHNIGEFCCGPVSLYKQLILITYRQDVEAVPL